MTLRFLTAGESMDQRWSQCWMGCLPGLRLNSEIIDQQLARGSKGTVLDRV